MTFSLISISDTREDLSKLPYDSLYFISKTISENSNNNLDDV